MKLCPKFEVVYVALLNRNPLPSLEVCVGELLREEQRLLTQAALSLDSVVSKAIIVAYIAQDKSKGRDTRQVKCYSCKQFGYIACHCTQKFCNYCNQRGHIITDYPTHPP